MHEDVQFADDVPRRKPDYEVKRPACEVFWKDPTLVDPCPPAGIEIRTTDDVPALLLNGVDVAEELKRVRWFAMGGYVMGAVGIALSVCALILIFLAH